ncbi:sigma-70 family RNA polymerase sigma factor [Tunturiibacter empetritectus]|uniref:RNA polymerase sigma-70 factor (ECF subfamily) n=2 Tax=Tunturiibacter TaxID=3154218 RepID=A0A852VKG8_9BACT|nr:sigma-70 family RNA polymerase sigma factor [Edaphobacter lichenicola]NYF92130.1 RNA polymerase sigma-70 factor (ECF subfamily) [Edaphobacter lichenicola]
MDVDLTFEQLVRDHQAMVFRTLLRLTGSREHLDDLAQDVFLRLYRALPSFRGEALITTYLYRIAVNVAQDEWKRRRRDDRSHVSLSDDTSAWEERLAHPDRNAEQKIEEREFQQAVDEQLQRLSQIERTILILYHQEERSYEQISYTLGMPIGTVRTHLHRGRKKLREAIKQNQTSERRTACQTN